MTILNDSRPYTIQVEVIVERKLQGKYVEVGMDKSLSTKTAKDIYKRLIEGRGRRNMIDDFRAF